MKIKICFKILETEYCVVKMQFFNCSVGCGLRAEF